MRSLQRTLRPLLGFAVAGAIAAVLLLAGPGLADLPSSVSDTPRWFTDAPEQALVTVVGAAAWACLLWLCVGVVLGSLAALPGTAGRTAARLARWMLPRVLRRALEVSLGLTLVAGSAGGLLAATPASASAPAGGPAATASAWPNLSTPGGGAVTAWPNLASPPGTPAAPAPTTPAPTRTAPATTPSASADLPDDMPIFVFTPADQHAPATGVTPTTAETGAPDPGASSSPSSSSSPAPAATPAASPWRWTPAAQPVSGPVTGWPDLAPAGGSDPAVPAAPRGIGVPGDGDQGAGEVVVLRGDSLWEIAARQLGPAATDAQIAAEWPRWWAANRDVIGPDPNVILPGQRLRPPPGP